MILFKRLYFLIFLISFSVSLVSDAQVVDYTIEAILNHRFSQGLTKSILGDVPSVIFVDGITGVTLGAIPSEVVNFTPKVIITSTPYVFSSIINSGIGLIPPTNFNVQFENYDQVRWFINYNESFDFVIPLDTNYYDVKGKVRVNNGISPIINIVGIKSQPLHRAARTYMENLIKHRINDSIRSYKIEQKLLNVRPKQILHKDKENWDNNLSGNDSTSVPDKKQLLEFRGKTTLELKNPSRNEKKLDMPQDCILTEDTKHLKPDMNKGD